MAKSSRKNQPEPSSSLKARKHREGFGTDQKAKRASSSSKPRNSGKRNLPDSHAPYGSSKIPWPRILKEAQSRFGIKQFRLDQKDVLVVVVSPLVALMQDQEEKAAEAEIAVEKVDSTLTRVETRDANEQIRSGMAQLIYVTPERLETAEFLAMLKAAGGISLLVVDEAHCITQWGHDFLPAYLAIGDARKALGMPPVLALTATATEAVIQEIQKSLLMEDARIVNAGMERENLHLSVFTTVNTEYKLERVTQLLAEESGSGIIYTASVRSANELFTWLKEHDVSVAHYHGRMKIHEREAMQEAFMHGEQKVMIATKAFGLGIDKPDIRFVYHFEFPDSVETYFQEAGRAGRDGLPSRAILLYRLEDKRLQSFFLAGRYPKDEDINAILHVLVGDEVSPQASARKTLADDACHEMVEASARDSSMPSTKDGAAIARSSSPPRQRPSRSRSRPRSS